MKEKILTLGEVPPGSFVEILKPPLLARVGAYLRGERREIAPYSSDGEFQAPKTLPNSTPVMLAETPEGFYTVR